MYKQVIVVNKELNMSAGKMAAMVAHGSVSFFTNWFKRNVSTENSTWNEYAIYPDAKIDKELFAQWIAGNFTKIILEADNIDVMKSIIEKAHEYNMINGKDFFNIVDESTEFNDIPSWAVIAFAPMDSERINQVTGHLNLYGYEDSSLSKEDDKYSVRYVNGKRVISEKIHKY